MGWNPTRGRKGRLGLAFGIVCSHFSLFFTRFPFLPSLLSLIMAKHLLASSPSIWRELSVRSQVWLFV
jgi:hypothetical protein